MRRDRAKSYRTIIKKLTVKLPHAQLRRARKSPYNVEERRRRDAKVKVKKDPGKWPQRKNTQVSHFFTELSKQHPIKIPPTGNSAREKAGEKTLQQFILEIFLPIETRRPRDPWEFQGTSSKPVHSI